MELWIRTSPVQLLPLPWILTFATFLNTIYVAWGISCHGHVCDSGHDCAHPPPISLCPVPFAASPGSWAAHALFAVQWRKPSLASRKERVHMPSTTCTEHMRRWWWSAHNNIMTPCGVMMLHLPWRAEHPWNAPAVIIIIFNDLGPVVGFK